MCTDIQSRAAAVSSPILFDDERSRGRMRVEAAYGRFGRPRQSLKKKTYLLQLSLTFV